LISDLTKEGLTPWWPDLLPGDRHVLFTAIGPQGPDAASIEVLSLSDGTRTPLVRAATFGRYLRDGYLLYVNQGTLYAGRSIGSSWLFKGRESPYWRSASRTPRFLGTRSLTFRETEG
jgi:hypothetical protein